MSEPSPRGNRWSLAGPAGLGAALWLVAHFLRYDGLDPRWVGGELDILVPAQAIAGGQRLNASIGSIHGHLPGAYVEALLLALPLRLGLEPLLLSRLVASGLGAIFAALVALTGALAAPNEARARWVGGAAAALAVAIAWPNLHREYLGVWGSTPEALPLLLGAHLLAWKARRPLEAALAGGLCGLAWLLSPVALPGAASCLVLGLLRRPSFGGRGAALFTTGLGCALASALLLPGGPGAMGAFLSHNLKTFGGAGPLAAGGQAVPLWAYVPGAPAGSTALDAPETLPLSLLACLVAVAVVGASRRARTGPGPLAVAALVWLPVVLMIQREELGYAAGYRYWALPVGLGFGIAAGRLEPTVERLEGRSRIAAALVGAAALIGILLSPPAPVPAPEHPWLRLGLHRMSERPAVGPGRSERFATFETLVGVLPPGEPRAEATFGFGAEYGHSLQSIAGPPDPAEWRPTWLKLALEPEDWRAFLLGLGCGTGVAGSWRVGSEEVLRPLDAVDWGVVRRGWDGCDGDGAGPIAAHEPWAGGLPVSDEVFVVARRALRRRSGTAARRSPPVRGLSSARAPERRGRARGRKPRPSGRLRDRASPR